MNASLNYLIARQGESELSRAAERGRLIRHEAARFDPDRPSRRLIAAFRRRARAATDAAPPKPGAERRVDAAGRPV